MKKLVSVLMILLMPIIFGLAVVVADTITGTHVIDPNALPAPGSGWGEWLNWILTVGIWFVYEIVVMYVPTVKNWSILTKILNLLAAIAKLFNGVGNKAKMPDGSHGVFKITKETL